MVGFSIVVYIAAAYLFFVLMVFRLGSLHDKYTLKTGKLNKEKIKGEQIFRENGRWDKDFVGFAWSPLNSIMCVLLIVVYFIGLFKYMIESLKVNDYRIIAFNRKINISNQFVSIWNLWTCNKY